MHVGLFGLPARHVHILLLGLDGPIFEISGLGLFSLILIDSPIEVVGEFPASIETSGGSFGAGLLIDAIHNLDLLPFHRQQKLRLISVSYTHLTLPTILLV